MRGFNSVRVEYEEEEIREQKERINRFDNAGNQYESENVTTKEPYEIEPSFVFDNELFLNHEGNSKIPDWLSGTFVRNGPAWFDLGNYHVRHWFDGLAMLIKFEFKAGKVIYNNRMLKTEAYYWARAKGELGFREFATETHPTRFRDLANMINPRISDNAVVSVLKVNNSYIAMADGARPVAFDLKTLKTLGHYKFDDLFNVILTTPHPHYDPRREAIFTYVTTLEPALFKKSRVDLAYRVCRIDKGSNKRKIIATIPTNRISYIHGLGMTENWVILIHNSFVLTDPFAMNFKHRPVLDEYHWLPDQEPTRFYAVHKDSGKVRTWLSDKAFFNFHNINAYEEGEDLIVDISLYDHPQDATTLLLFDHLTRFTGGSIPIGCFARFCLTRGSKYAQPAPGFDWGNPFSAIEMPAVNKYFNGKKYRYAYGIGSAQGVDVSNFFDRLVKFDLKNTDTKPKIFYLNEDEPTNYFTEPVFVPEPHRHPNCTKHTTICEDWCDAHDEDCEDRGVVLSVGLATQALIDGRSFLAILDAKEFNLLELLYLPHIIPFGLHGNFFST
jgi:carotenoid cleavage dioxygenase-like enzyme